MTILLVEDDDAGAALLTRSLEPRLAGSIVRAESLDEASEAAEGDLT